MLDAIWLGIVQGLAEFLPISSSGHVAVLSHFFRSQPASVALQLVLHLGTLLATVFALRGTLLGYLQGTFDDSGVGDHREPRRELGYIFAASVPTAVIGLSLRSVADVVSEQPALVATLLLFTAGLLLVARFSSEAERPMSLGVALIIGIAQGVAVLPGISRSGITIVAALFLGMQRREAFRWSFLLSLPAVGGAFLLEAASGGLASVPAQAWVGGAVAFVLGLASFYLLRRVVDSGRLWFFGAYLVLVAGGLLASTAAGLI